MHNRKLKSLLLFSTLLAAPGCSVDLFDPLQTGSYEYTVRTPQGYGSTTKDWPVIVFLHGSDGVERNYIGDYASANEPFGFIVVMPETKFEWEPHRLNNMLDEVLEQYRADDRRVYVTGFSMGAHGSFFWAADEPDRIAAAVMVAGATHAGQGCRIKNTPTWFIHNRNDPTVPTSETEQTVKELQACNADVRVTINEFPPLANTHNAWLQAYHTPDIYSWMLSHSL